MEKKELTQDELDAAAKTLDTLVKQLECAKLSPLLGFALTGIRGGLDAVNGESSNRKTAPVENVPTASIPV